MVHNRAFATKDVSQTKQKRWTKEGQQLERAGQGTWHPKAPASRLYHAPRLWRRVRLWILLNSGNLGVEGLYLSWLRSESDPPHLM